jgi:alkanesulfonate monooxygenase SsuD/methylene tetrahydromethanopterin reductase-like flavin-dependent oxidoreductase (luciferase family)
VKEIAVHSPGHVADTDAQAREEYWVGYKGMHDRIGAERGWPPIGRAQFDQEVEHGSLYVGAPETVARKIAATAKALGHRALRHEIQRWHAGARQDDAQHRALRQQGHAAGAGDAGPGRWIEPRAHDFIGTMRRNRIGH